MREVATQLRGKYYSLLTRDNGDSQRLWVFSKMRSVTDRIRATDPDDLDAVDRLRDSFHAEYLEIRSDRPAEE